MLHRPLYHRREGILPKKVELYSRNAILSLCLDCAAEPEYGVELGVIVRPTSRFVALIRLQRTRGRICTQVQLAMFLCTSRAYTYVILTIALGSLRLASLPLTKLDDAQFFIIKYRSETVALSFFLPYSEHRTTLSLSNLQHGGF